VILPTLDFIGSTCAVKVVFEMEASFGGFTDIETSFFGFSDKEATFSMVSDKEASFSLVSDKEATFSLFSDKEASTCILLDEEASVWGLRFSDKEASFDGVRTLAGLKKFKKNQSLNHP
jgi:hypothetical protein